MHRTMALFYIKLLMRHHFIAFFLILLTTLQLSQSYDSRYGGFGSAPKFPRPVEIQLMLYHSKKLDDAGNYNESKKGLQMVFFTLQCMARGGIHDHIGGGFHRYSVDERWHGWFVFKTIVIS